jgi:hypothetical protein
MTRTALVPVEATSVGIHSTGLTEGGFYRRFVAGGTIAVGQPVEVSTTTSGRVSVSNSASDMVIGVALDAATIGTTLRVMHVGVCQMLVDIGFTVVRGDQLAPNQDSVRVSTGSGATFSTAGSWGVALEPNANSGVQRLVWAFLFPVQGTIAAPASGYPVDVSYAAEADGTFSQPARADHRHTLGAIAFSRGGTILNPVAATWVNVWRAPFACTVTAVKALRVGGSAMTANARKNGTSNHLASAVSVGSADTWTDGGAVQNTAYAAGDRLEIAVVTHTGATQAAIQVDYTRP